MGNARLQGTVPTANTVMALRQVSQCNTDAAVSQEDSSKHAGKHIGSLKTYMTSMEL